VTMVTINVVHDIEGGVCGFQVTRTTYGNPVDVPGSNMEGVQFFPAETDQFFVPDLHGFWCPECDHYTLDRDHFGGCCKDVRNVDVFVCTNCETIHGSTYARSHLTKCYGGNS
jgi:hypothetical protein